ncbi:MAG: hypothetical protein AAF552_14995 [Pseudomonadota bacterium]
MSNTYSSEKLLEFLKQSAMAGQLNPATARSRRNAAEQLLSQLGDEEAADLRELDVDQLCARFHKLQGSSIRTETLSIYGERLKAALQDFIAWSDNPEGFVPSTAETRQLRRRSESSGKAGSEEQQALEQIKLTTVQQPPDLLPIPIRPELVVYVQNLPLDLTTDEAAKIARIVQAHAEAEGDAE